MRISSLVILLLFATTFVAVLNRQHVEAASIIGIDLGTEWIKIGIARSGYPIDLVLNEQSKRKTLAMIGFRDKDRFFGDNAKALSIRFPYNMFRYLNLVLGKSSDQLDRVQERYNELKVPIRLAKNESRGSIDIVLDENTRYSTEELFAMIFRYIKQLAHESAKAPVLDCVITVPHFYSIQQRQAIYDAAAIAELRILSLMHESTAIALQYALTRYKILTDQREPYLVAFYDMGAASTKVAIATYVNHTSKPSEYIGSFFVNMSKWDENLGGADFDIRLANYFATHFQKKHGHDLTKEPKVMARLIDAAKKTKEVLSANTETVAMIEGLYDDKDFVLPITRVQFEELCADLLERVTTPLHAALTELGINKDNIHTFEILGGATRIPMIQSKLKQYIGDNKDLSFSLNADEAIALGSTFHAAFISPAFKVKSFNFKDIFPFELDFVLSKSSQSDTESKPLVLYNKNEELGHKKTINIPREEDFIVQVKYNESSAPSGFTAQNCMLSEHEIIDVKKVMSNLTTENEKAKKKVRVSFELSNSGILKFDTATAILEETVTIRVDPPNKESGNKTTLDETIPQEQDSKNKTGEEKPVYKKEKRISKVQLKTQTKNLSPIKPLTEKEKADAKLRLAQLDQYDALKKEISRVRNALESSFYELRYQTLEDEKFKPFYTDQEAKNLVNKIEEVEAWLSENDEENVVSKEKELSFKEKLRELTAVSQPIFDRFEQLALREKAIQDCRNIFNRTMQYVNRFKELSKHITDEEWNELLTLSKGIETWVNESIAKQAASPLHQAPVVLASEFIEKCEKVAEKAIQLARKPIPKPDKSKASRNETVAKEDDVNRKQANSGPSQTNNTAPEANSNTSQANTGTNNDASQANSDTAQTPKEGDTSTASETKKDEL